MLAVSDYPPEQYVFKRLKLLRKFGVDPVVVFDGDELPAKEQVAQARKKLVEEIPTQKTHVQTFVW